jgi:hypothetical protein
MSKDESVLPVPEHFVRIDRAVDLPTMPVAAIAAG